MKSYRLEIYRENNGRGDWRWRAVAKNGRTVADSGEGYRRKCDCVRIARSLMPNVQHREL